MSLSRTLTRRSLVVDQLPGLMQPSRFTQICRSTQSREDIHDNIMCATPINFRGSTKRAESFKSCRPHNIAFLKVLIKCTGHTFEHLITFTLLNTFIGLQNLKINRKVRKRITEAQEKFTHNPHRLKKKKRFIFNVSTASRSATNLQLWDTPDNELEAFEHRKSQSLTFELLLNVKLQSPYLHKSGVMSVLRQRGR